MKCTPAGQAESRGGLDQERPEYVRQTGRAWRTADGKITVNAALAARAAGAGAGYDRTDTRRIIGLKL